MASAERASNLQYRDLLRSALSVVGVMLCPVTADERALEHYRTVRGTHPTGATLWRLGVTESAPDGAALYIGDELEPAVHLQPRELRSLAAAAAGVALEFELEDAGPGGTSYAFAGLRDGAGVLDALADSNSASLTGWLEHLLAARAVLDERLADYAGALAAALKGDVDTLDEWGETAETLARDVPELVALLGCTREAIDAWLANPSAGPPPFEPKAWRRLDRAEQADRRRE